MRGDALNRYSKKIQIIFQSKLNKNTEIVRNTRGCKTAVIIDFMRHITNFTESLLHKYEIYS